MSWFKKLWYYVFTTEHMRTTTTTSTTTRSNGSHLKTAICIGINNYPGTNNDLRGCINDAKAWAEILESFYGFSPRLMLDANATVSEVKAAILNEIAKTQDGDSLVVTYSGHGSNVKDTNGDEADGRDETWYLYDGNLKDDSIKKVLSTLPEGVNLTIISDSCHSGTVTRSFLQALETQEYIKARYMPPEDDIEAISTTSLPIFSNAFSDDDMNHVLVSGCKSSEYSYDASFNGVKMGAMSYYATKIIRDNPSITYDEFYRLLKNKLPSGSYPQTPCLEGTAANTGKLIFQ